MAVDDLRYKPDISYAELAKTLRDTTEALEFAGKKAERVGVMLAGIADYIYAKPVIDDKDREFILDCIKQHYDNEFKILQEQRERLKANGIV